MRQIGRIAAGVAALLLCLGIQGAFHAAGRGKFTLTADAGKLARGSEFTVTLQCNRNPGVKDMRLTLAYDRQTLEVLEIQDLELFPGGRVEQKEDGDVLSFRAEAHKTSFDQTGNVAKIKFRVKGDAPFGSSRVSVSYSERLLDIRDAKGSVIPFDVREWQFELICPHANVSREILQPATLSTEGSARVTCTDCGESWEEVLRPEITSADGKVRAVLSPGVFAEGTDPGISVEYIFGGADSDTARELFGTRLIRAFRIHFFTTGGDVLPMGDIAVILESEVELPEYVSLYAWEGGGTARLEPERNGNVLRFPWQDALFLLVNTPPEEEPEQNEDEEPVSGEAAVTSTLSPEEEKRRRDGITLGVSGAVLIVTGIGIALLLRRKKY
ncbi:MAG: hypothetical protein J6Z79_04855 [Clostridia bacterium]|nr:hypothetical protein [Clostridia bacterium]